MSRVQLRHIVKGAETDPGAVQVLGVWYAPQDLDGLNTGQDGWQDGLVDTPRVNEDGTVTIRLANKSGGDGELHRQRFLIIRHGRRIPVPGGFVFDSEGGTYRPGDEWIEAWEGEAGKGDLLATCTPTKAVVTVAAIELTLVDPAWLLRKTRETTVGFWNHAPRDIFEQCTRVWTASASHDFETLDEFPAASSALQNSSDGLWKVRNFDAQPIAGGASLSYSLSGPFPAPYEEGFIATAESFPVGPGSSDPHGHHRLEAEFEVLDPSVPDGVALQFAGGPVGPATADATGIAALAVTASVWAICQTGDGPDVFQLARLPADVVDPRRTKLAIEIRGRWVYFFVQGRLVAVLPITTGSSDARAYAFATPNTVYPGARVAAIHSLVYRRTRPFLMRGADRGDYRTGGAPTPGGLAGEYFDNGDIALKPVDEVHRIALNPTREPYARRVDAQINFSGATWQPVGPPNGEHFAARWTGSIYLDLAAQDWHVRFTGVDGGVRCWIGKTRFGEQAVDGWAGGAADYTSGSLRGQLGEKSGWYPIVIEFINGPGPSNCWFQWQPGAGAWANVPSEKLSPYGIVNEHVRLDSHFETLQQLATAWGIQWRCEPRSLESGLFPGEMVPRLRVGRDTEYELTAESVTGAQAQLSAEEVADAIIADAQGIAGDTGGQLTAEMFNFGELRNHLFVMQEYTSLAEISEERLLRQRLSSELALRGSVWEEVGLQPTDGSRQLLDRWPLPAPGAEEPEEFSWQAGDGVRVNHPELGVDDDSPRQILGVPRVIRPDGVGLPQASFRQRPRNLRETLRRLNRQTLAQVRNYQGQSVQVDGSIGGNTAAAADLFSRISLPPAFRVISAWVTVSHKSDGSTWNVFVNNALPPLGPSVSRRADYDITAWANTRHISVDLRDGTGTVEYQLHALVMA